MSCGGIRSAYEQAERMRRSARGHHELDAGTESLRDGARDCVKAARETSEWKQEDEALAIFAHDCRTTGGKGG